MEKTRHKTIQLRVNPEEYEAFQEAAVAGGWPNVSEMIRALVAERGMAYDGLPASVDVE